MSFHYFISYDIVVIVGITRRVKYRSFHIQKTRRVSYRSFSFIQTRRVFTGVSTFKQLGGFHTGVFILTSELLGGLSTGVSILKKLGGFHTGVSHLYKLSSLSSNLSLGTLKYFWTIHF